MIIRASQQASTQVNPTFPTLFLALTPAITRPPWKADTMEDHHNVNTPVAASTPITDDELNTSASTRTHLTRPRAAGPATVADQYDRGTRIARFNSALAVAITKGVGSMWCAYAFAVLTIFGLPSAIHDGLASTVQWIAQTFLQLVLLSIILVGQNVQAAAADKRALGTYRDTEEILLQVSQIHAHLLGQDTALQQQQAMLDELHHCLDIDPTPNAAPQERT